MMYRVFLRTVPRLIQSVRYTFCKNKLTKQSMDSLKKQAKQFYEEEVIPNNIKELTSIGEFDQFVSKSKVPVVLVCYNM